MGPPEYFDHLIHRFSLTALAHGISYTRFQVFFQDHHIYLPQLRLHRLGLGEDVNTVLALLHHGDNFVQVAFGNFQSMQWSCPAVSPIHVPHFNPPPGDLSSRHKSVNIIVMPNLWLVFSTGLLTGGVTCLAVQGGLLTASLAATGGADSPPRSRFLPTLAFVSAKLVAYIALGAALGFLGTAVQPSPIARAVFQGLVAVYMLGVAGALLDLHPVFRYFIFSPPRFVTRWLRSTSKSTDVQAGQLFTPALLGAATVLIPCGTTQAMMVLALASANPLWGAAIMGAFVLGTWPLFLGLGAIVTGAQSAFRSLFIKLASVGIAVMAVWTFSGALALSGHPVNLAAAASDIYCTLTFCGPVSASAAAANHATIEILPNGYRTDNSVLKAGSQVQLTLKNSGAQGCVQAFTIPALGISQVVPPGTTKDIQITVPQKAGTLAYTCAMGMYSGQFTVVN